MKEKPLRTLLNQLNSEYSLSEQFKTKVLALIEKLEGFNLPQEQLDALAAKIRETYKRQNLVESHRKESQKSLERIHDSIVTFSSALNNINQKLNQAETALEGVLHSKSASPPASTPPVDAKRESFLSQQRAKALVAFATINSKNSRIH
jgi:septal ring factor EnvC (AmiA/AmiB activator)